MRWIQSLVLVSAVLAIAGCAGLTTQQQRALSGGAIGAGSGAAIGLIGGPAGALVGGVVGGAAGVVSGAYWEDIKKATK